MGSCADDASEPRARRWSAATAPPPAPARQFRIDAEPPARKSFLKSAKAITRLRPFRNWNTSQYQQPSHSKKFRKRQPLLANSLARRRFCACAHSKSGFFPGQLDGHVKVAQPVYFQFQHAAEKNDPGYLGQEVGILVDPRHALKKLQQRSSAVARVTGLAAVAAENVCPACVMVQIPRPAASIRPSAYNSACPPAAGSGAVPERGSHPEAPGIA